MTDTPKTPIILHAIDALRREETTALPYLEEALTRFLQEYPWTSDGLSRTERRLLQLASDGSVMLAKVFPQMGRDDRFYTVTDLSLLTTAREMSRSGMTRVGESKTRVLTRRRTDRCQRRSPERHAN